MGLHVAADYCARDPSSRADRTACGRAPESGYFRRPTGRWRARTDRRRARRRRAICLRSVGRWKALTGEPGAAGVRGRANALNRTHAQPRRLRHQDTRPVGRLARRVSERQRYDALGRLRAQRLDARGTRLIAKQAVERPP
jgi:hypothetical protein